MQDKIFHAKPKVYGWLYLGCIPLYGLIYFFIPETIGLDKSLVECFYFSTVTITTLGYGDILPQNDFARFIAATESVLGLILIGLFLNSLSRVRGETSRSVEIEKEKESYRYNEIAKLNGFYNLINPILEKYKSSVIRITQPLESQRNDYNENFSFNDMKDLFKPSLLRTQGINEPAVKYYFTSLKLLNDELYDLVKNVDLRLFPSLEEYSLTLVRNVHSYDFSEAILSAINTNIGEKKMVDYVSEIIERHEGEVKFHTNANIIDPYVALFFQIKIQMEVLKSFEKEIKSLLEKNKKS